MYLAFVVSRLLKGIRAAAGGENIVVTGCQKSRDEAQNGRLIVHYKNGLLSVLRCGRFHRCHSLLFSAERWRASSLKKIALGGRRTPPVSHITDKRRAQASGRSYARARLSRSHTTLPFLHGADK